MRSCHAATLLRWFALQYGARLTKSAPDARPQPAESNVLRHIAELERIGYRTVGTQEAILGEEYVIDQVRELERMCKIGGGLPSPTGPVLDCEVWVQTGKGYHSCVFNRSIPAEPCPSSESSHGERNPVTERLVITELMCSFNILEHDVLKLYQGIRNVILRVQPKPGMGERADKDAILLGSHIDSTLPAPGAAE
jgi:hypothetical protein